MRSRFQPWDVWPGASNHPTCVAKTCMWECECIGAREAGGPGLAGFYQAPDQFRGVCGLV
jgi:hypothetical protein